MKMPKKIDDTLLAPCGMNCLVCYKHCNTQNPCAGCSTENMDQPNHCRTCKIKQCALEKNLAHCFACASFPCKLLYSIEKSYQKRYRVSLIENSRCARKSGVSAFLQKERIKWTCPHCEGVVSLHDNQCSACGLGHTALNK